MARLRSAPFTWTRWPKIRPSPPRSPETTSTPGVLAAARAAAVVSDEELPDRVLEGRAQALPEHGDEGDQAESDHQGGRGRGGAARVASCVLARESARCAADARSRPAEREGKRPHQEWREEGDAEEEKQAAAAEREQPIGRREAVSEDPVDEEEDADGEDGEPGRRPEARQP